jgi:hypothetical protein
MNRSSPHRGLLAGLLALVVSASGAVALAARGTPGTAGTGAQSATAAVASGTTRDGEVDGGRFGTGDGGRDRRESLADRSERGR